MEGHGKEALLEEIRKISGIKVHYVRQPYMRGLGDAILCAREFVDDEPFGVILGDDVVYNGKGEPALHQLIRQYEKTGITIVGGAVGCQGAGAFLWYHRWENRDGS